MNNHFKYLIVICSLLLGLLLCSVDCPRKKEPCHDTITVVNNSDSVVTICEFSHDVYDNTWSLTNMGNVNPKDAGEFSPLITGYQCYEEELLNAPNARYSSIFILSNTYQFIETSTYDSLFIVYDVLKYIDLAKLGPDSLYLTDYTVYYP